jgi:protein XagA
MSLPVASAGKDTFRLNANGSSGKSTTLRRNDMRRHHLKAVALAMIFIMAFATACFAGAWTPKQHAFYDKLAFNYYSSGKNFDSTGYRVGTANNGTFTDYNISNYFEYGLLDNLTLINSLTYKWLVNDSDLSRSKGYGIGDIDLGLRYKLLDHEKIGIVSSQLLFKIPGPYDRKDPLPLGNGQLDTEIKLLYGRSLYPWIPGYGNVELGYRWRYDGPSDEVRYLVEFGVDITRSLFTRAKLDGILSVNNGKKIDGSGNPTTTNNFDLGKLDLTLGYKITPAWGVEASYVPAIYGQNTAAGATYTLGIYFKTP